MDDLRRELDEVLSDGVPPIGRTRHPEVAREHARIFAEGAAILEEAFSREGLNCVVVGGSAVEIHVPGLHVSGDMDIVLEGAPSVRAPEVTSVFRALGFSKVDMGMWERDGLVVHPCGRFLEGESEEIPVGSRPVRVAARESLIVERIGRFRHLFLHKAVSEGEGYELAMQGIELLEAFRGELDPEWVERELEREGALDVYKELRRLLERTGKQRIGKPELQDVLDKAGIRTPGQVD